MEKSKMGLFDGMDLGGGTAVATEERVAGSSNSSFIFNYLLT